MMIETLVLLAFCAIDAALIIAWVFFGWRPFSRVLSRIWARRWRFLLVFLGTMVGLTIAFPWIDTAFYESGYVLSDDYTIFVYPTLTIILSLAAGIFVVWELEKRRDVGG